MPEIDSTARVEDIISRHRIEIPEWIDRRPELTPAHKRLYARLQFRIGDNPFTWVSQQVLAADLGVTDRTVRNHLKALMEFGLVRVEHTIRNNRTYLITDHVWRAEYARAVADRRQEKSMTSVPRRTRTPAEQPEEPFRLQPETAFRPNKEVTSKKSQEETTRRASRRRGIMQTPGEDYGHPLEDQNPARAKRDSVPGKHRKDSVPALATYFRDTMTAAGWSSTWGPMRLAPVRATLRRWLDVGRTPDQVRSMIDVFVDKGSWRGAKVEPFKMLAWRQEELWRVVEHRFSDGSEWIDPYANNPRSLFYVG